MEIDLNDGQLPVDGISLRFAGQSRWVYWMMFWHVVIPGMIHGRNFEVFGTIEMEQDDG